jgi:hypothetical protein
VSKPSWITPSRARPDVAAPGDEGARQAIPRHAPPPTRLARLRAVARAPLASRLGTALVRAGAAFAAALLPLVLASCNLSSGGFVITKPAHLRFFNALVDGGAINVTVSQDALVSGLPFEGITTYQDVSAGNPEIKITIAGGTATIYETTALVIDDTSYTYVVYGTSAAPRVALLVDSTVQTPPPDGGTFRLRVQNASAGTAAFDVYLTQPGVALDNISPNFGAVGYGAVTVFATIDAAALQLRLTLPNSKQVIYDAGTIGFAEKTAYDIVAYTRGSSTLVNAALLVNDATGTGSIANSLLAQFKFVQAATGTAAVNALADNAVAFANVPYQNATGYESLAAGPHTITVEAVTSPGAVIASARPPFAAATDTSVVVTGLPGAQTAVVLNDMNLPGTAGNARVRYVNVSPDAGPVDVLVNFAKQVSALGADSASSYVESLENSYTVDFNAAGTTNVILSVPSVSLTAGRTYTMYLVGTSGRYGTILTRDD